MNYGKIIGVGKTATVYEWEEGKVLKLFNQGYPKKAAEKEFHNAQAINHMDFAKPKAYKICSIEKRMGIVYDRAEGESLLDWLMKTGDLQGCATYMADLHKTIVRNKVSDMSSYKEFLKSNIKKALPIGSKKRKEALQALNKLQDGNILCHGDFHPGNILISDGHTMVIDFMNICRGDFLYDVARTVFLVQYTPAPMEVENREKILQFRKTLTDLYLMQMNVTREMIQDYLSLIITARMGECPDE